MPEAGESALILITNILPNLLHSVFVVSICGGGNFMGVLRVRATMLHFLQSVGISRAPVILPLLRRFRIVTKSYYLHLSVCLSVRIEQLSSHLDNFH
jgi:hypothetical protein